MLRPNMALDAPPASLEVGGIFYKIDTDYRAWLEVLSKMRRLVPAPNRPEHAAKNAEIISQIEQIVFGKIIPHPAADALKAIMDFSGGYPDAPVGEGGNGKQTYSFDYDLNYIIIAIQNQFGIDLSYRRKEPFHWWEFLLYFKALCGNHYILRLMEIRGYDGKDSEMKRQSQRYALPRETTGEEQAMLDEFNDLFYNA